MCDQCKAMIRNIECYCLKESCGDPIPNTFSTIAQYSKRRMVFRGWDWTGSTGQFMCPVCGHTRRFKENRMSHGYTEVR
jgi:hypothetical protein